MDVDTQVMTDVAAGLKEAGMPHVGELMLDAAVEIMRLRHLNDKYVKWLHALTEGEDRERQPS